MSRADICYLVAEDPQAHGIFDKPAETPRMVFCTVRSVGQQEYYRARENGLEPTVVFVTPAVNYHGEKIILWTPPGGAQRRYRVVRTYQGTDQVEITCEEATIDREPPTPPETEGSDNG